MKKISINDDLRLLYASFPIITIITIYLSMQLAFPLLGFLIKKNPFNKFNFSNKTLDIQNKVYPVLIEQKEKILKDKDEIKAYSDKNSSGSGGITAKYGFHTLSDQDNLQLNKKSNSSKSQNSKQISKQSNSKDFEFSKNKDINKSNNKSSAANQYRIPSNYRFRSDFLLRFDGSTLLSMPLRELAGFEYFRSLINKLRNNFAPPGINYRFQDRAGYVVNEAIIPQIVKVAFALDPEGNVSDVHVVSSIGNDKVDEACMNSLRNQNFGPPPPEIFEKGNVFGINFVFPALN